jgi:hypothetical protein
MQCSSSYYPSFQATMESGCLTHSDDQYTFDKKLSLYIPRVLPSWRDQTRIAKIIKDCDIGLVSRIDFVDKVDAHGRPFCQAFVHFDSWFDNATARHIQERIEDPERQARIVYDDPKYWILLKNNKPITENEKILLDRIHCLEQSLSVEKADTAYWLTTILDHTQELDRRLTASEEREVEWTRGGAPMTMDELAQQTDAFHQEHAPVDDDSTPSSMPDLISPHERDVDGGSQDGAAVLDQCAYATCAESDQEDDFYPPDAHWGMGAGAAVGAPPQKKRRTDEMGPIRHDENGTPYTFNDETAQWEEITPVPMEIDSEDEGEMMEVDSTDDLSAQLSEVTIESQDDDAALDIALNTFTREYVTAAFCGNN